jgi:hypothetical protein
VTDGYELATMLRGELKLAHVGLIAVTGYGHDADRERAHAAGFDAHLVKPVDLEKVEQVIVAMSAEQGSVSAALFEFLPLPHAHGALGPTFAFGYWRGRDAEEKSSPGDALSHRRARPGSGGRSCSLDGRRQRQPQTVLKTGVGGPAYDGPNDLDGLRVEAGINDATIGRVTTVVAGSDGPRSR